MKTQRQFTVGDIACAAGQTCVQVRSFLIKNMIMPSAWVGTSPKVPAYSLAIRLSLVRLLKERDREEARWNASVESLRNRLNTALERRR